MKNLTILLLTLLIFGGCSLKKINSTLVCNDWSSKENFRSSLAIQIDNNNDRVFLKEVNENLSYSSEQNERLRLTGHYELKESQSQFKFDEWTRNFKEQGDEIIWKEKYSVWTFNKITLNLLIKPEEGREGKKTSYYCEKLDI